MFPNLGIPDPDSCVLCCTVSLLPILSEPLEPDDSAPQALRCLGNLSISSDPTNWATNHPRQRTRTAQAGIFLAVSTDRAVQGSSHPKRLPPVLESLPPSCPTESCRCFWIYATPLPTDYRRLPWIPEKPAIWSSSSLVERGRQAHHSKSLARRIWLRSYRGYFSFAACARTSSTGRPVSPKVEYGYRRNVASVEQPYPSIESRERSNRTSKSTADALQNPPCRKLSPRQTFAAPCRRRR